MTSFRNEGNVNVDTTLIDFKYEGVAGVGGVYLLEAGKSCLIDSGSTDGASHILKTLKKLKKFPPDYIILTHSHWDHSQGISVLRKNLKSNERSFEVFASEKAIPLLEDQSYNTVFKSIKFDNITNVSPLAEGDLIDLEGITLRIIEVPGHNTDHIAILDEKNKNLFVGDSIGIKIADDAFLSPIMPPNWNEADYMNTLTKLQQIDYDSVSLAHYGYIYGEEAKNILEESKKIFMTEKKVFETAKNVGKLEDLDYLAKLFLKEMKSTIPNLKLEKVLMRSMLGMINFGRTLLRKEPIAVGQILLKQILEMKVKGYKIAEGLK